jgi:HAMP domain-containing protein
VKLHVRFFLVIVTVLVSMVAVTTFVTTRGAIQAMLTQLETDGITLARLLAHSSDFAARIPPQVERVLGDQMVVEARIAAHLVAVAEQEAALSPAEINARLRDITEHTVLEEFWITDERGHAYLRTSEQDFTFSPDPDAQPQAHIFYPLLTQENGVVIQEARQREIDTRVFKYVGVSGVDQPRIVQVGYEAAFLEDLSRELNVQTLVDEFTGQGNVAAIRIFDETRASVAESTAPVDGIGETLDADDIALLDRALRSRDVQSALREDIFRVAVPLLNEGGAVERLALFYLLTDDVQNTVRSGTVRGVIVAASLVVIGAGLSFLLSRSITRPVRRLVEAARTIEQGQPFEAAQLADLTRSQGELANLARVFSHMAVEVQAREERLKQRVEALRIEIDEAKREQQVTEITETDYFRQLKEKAQDLRESKT